MKKNRQQTNAGEQNDGDVLLLLLQLQSEERKIRNIRRQKKHSRNCMCGQAGTNACCFFNLF